MSTSAITLVQPRTAVFARVADYIELTKPRIAIMELVVVLAAAVVATWGQPNPWIMSQALIGTLLVAASASAANQWLERHRDARMPRTADRPLPAGRLTSREVLAFSAITLLAGSSWLAALTTWQAALWAVATWVIYVLVYTPLKTRTTANTAVGAIAGAMPVLIGWTACDQPLDRRALALFLTLFLWQFPHFMAIAWLYREQYARAGYKMLTAVDSSGRRAGWQSVLAALALVPVSIVAVLDAPGLGSVMFAVAATVLGLAQLTFAAAFWREATESRARLLLRASLVYLPTVLLLLMLVPWL